MATGRGRLLQQYWLGLLARRPRIGGDFWAPGSAGEAARSAGFRMGLGVRLAAGCAAQNHCVQRDVRCEKFHTGCSVSLDSLPSEILLKILFYLDAVTLLCMGCVNRRFYHLANDNFIWIRIYSTAFSPKRSNWKVNSVEKTAVSMNLLSVGDKEAGYWKKEYITKQIASVKAALARVLKPVNPYTGLPVKTKEALRISGLGWVIIVKEKSGKEYTMEHVDLSINDSSVTIVWYGKNWPSLATLSTLDLCGVTPVFMDRSKIPTKNRYPCLSEFNFNMESFEDEASPEMSQQTYKTPPPSCPVTGSNMHLRTQHRCSACRRLPGHVSSLHPVGGRPASPGGHVSCRPNDCTACRGLASGWCGTRSSSPPHMGDPQPHGEMDTAPHFLAVRAGEVPFYGMHSPQPCQGPTV